MTAGARTGGFAGFCCWLEVREIGMLLEAAVACVYHVCLHTCV